MKRFITNISASGLLASVLVVMGPLQETRAQAQDTLDVAEGFETLNLAVEGDTLANGQRANPNRVYRLKRGGYYLLNGELRNPGFHLRIVAAEGSGHPPLLISAADETGASSRTFRVFGNLTVKGLYVSGIDDLGNQQEKNMFRADVNSVRIVIDDCFLDGEAQSFFRLNAKEQKLYMTNTIARNSVTLASPGNGRIIDTRGNLVDSIFVQNCTFYHCSDDVLRDGGGIIKNLFWDHVTTYAGEEMKLTRVIKAQITNSLFINLGFEGDITTDAETEGLMAIDSLRSPPLTEADRNIIIQSNNFGLTPGLKALFDSNDSLAPRVVYDSLGQSMIDGNAKITSERIISEDPGFTDAPDEQLLITWATYVLRYPNNPENNPDFRADRNGIKSISDDPKSFGIESDPYDFDYPASKQSYTYAAGGFPLGDLNWFPTRKAQWIAAGKPTTNVELVDTRIPVAFELSQNYPNPFNPTTTISFSLAQSAEVQLEIYNLLGQKVRSLVNDKLSAGTYRITWDGRSDTGVILPSGVYIYRMQANSQSLLRKMVLLK